jgi:hypothetical protein
VPLRVGPLKLPWPGKEAADDPYWDFYLNAAPNDVRNAVTDLVRRAPEGAVNPAKADIHTPEIMASHVKELARFLGAELVGIVRLDPASAATEEPYPFGVVAVVRAERDPREAPGIGGQVPVQNGQYVTFVLSAWIRELGYRATAVADPNREKLAVAAGLGTLNAAGRLVTSLHGANTHVADVVYTDLPVAADG